jgi:7-cyano-7-deazaguanine synthase in queuosine biosynthesis
MINVGEGFESGSCGPTLIDGEEKRCPVVAECNAAGKALSLLEHIRSVEVVDFNYEARHTKDSRFYKQFLHKLNTASRRR